MTALLIAVFDLAILATYPFPDAIEFLRGPFYVGLAVFILVATGFISFLGYRIITMRIERRSRALYVIFLPAIALVSSVIGFLFLAAPR